MRPLKKVAADNLAEFVASHIEHRLIAPLVMTVAIERIDGLARALQNIF